MSGASTLRTSPARRPWHQDRFMVCLVLAFGLHAVVLLGVRFGFSLDPAPRIADTLDVVLVKWRSEQDPDEADFLAQASQRGGGETTERQRPSRPVSGELPVPEKGLDPAQSVESMPTPQTMQREVVATEVADETPLETTAVEQPDLPQPSAARLMRQSMDMASLQPEVSRHRQWQSKLPRRKVISANTKEYEFASYMSAWVAKVERVGNLNYPLELRERNLHGDLVLSVGIQADGSIESIKVMRSSGLPEIDRAAENIVLLAAPYAPLPDNITDQVDILHITRTWRFESRFGAD
ncbi:energy transducer TonB [Elongatibacter sediminis]|uniref:TonB family protein n=1 Tax=Elongatibacter sediminis TaxID=3119006 RepID=A0AAW9RF99_9GAMM